MTGLLLIFVEYKLLHNLRDLEIITWFGSSKNDRNQYYLLVDK
ncbi:transcriptional regulator [Streptococcus suis]|nr:transcriptional regulator [Streptococcus suis]